MKKSTLVALNSLGRKSNVPQSIIVNGGFDNGDGWNLEAGWTISGGKANATSSSFTSVRAIVPPFLPGISYDITYTVTVEAGAVFVACGATSEGVWRDANGTYTDTLVPDVNGDLSFVGAISFTGTIDDVSAVRV